MDLPQPPQDEDLRNIIDKLAVFVARNGVEFESMTKQKQRDNPRFAFLFGGEFFNYYMCRVTTEQAILKHNAMREQQQRPGQSMMGGPGPNFPQFGGPGPGAGPGPGPGQGPRMPPPSGQNPFDMSSQQGFDRSQVQGFENPNMQNFQRGPGGAGGPGGPGPGSRFDNRQFNDFGERPGSGPGPGHGPGKFQQRQSGNFDQGPGPSGFDQGNFGPGQGPRGNFDQHPRMMGPGSFDQRQSQGQPGPPGAGNFQGQGPSRGFEPRMQNAGPGPGNFDQRSSVPRKFDQRPPGGGNFDIIGPPGIVSNFELGPPGVVGETNFEPRKSVSRFDHGPPGTGPGLGPGSNIDQISGQGFDPRMQKQQLQQGGFDSPGQNIPAGQLKGFGQVQTVGVGLGSGGLGSMPVVPTPAINVEVLTKQKLALEDQIRQSGQNLHAQHQVLLTQQQTQIDEAIRQLQENEMMQLANDLNVDLNEFDQILQPIIDSCTKDAISAGKAWIFTHTSTPRHYRLVTSFLLKKTMDPTAVFNQRLHIIYLVNDVLHHCMRKGADDLQQALEAMVIPMFCYSRVSESSDEDHVAKLEKLFNLWETKSNYVSAAAVEKLRNFNQTLVEFKNDLMTKYAVVVAQIANSIQQTYEGYQNQHQLFVQHVDQSVTTLEQQIQQGRIQDQIRLQQKQQQELQQKQQQALQLQQQQLLQQQQQAQQQQQQGAPHMSAMGMGGPGGLTPGGMPLGPGGPMVPGMTGFPGPGPSGPGLGVGVGGTGPPNIPIVSGGLPTTHIIAPPYIPPGADIGIPDLSRPPPGFPTPPPDKDLIPALPYYELPAGLMVTLVRLEEDNYKPIDPKTIRLPPPCPPSDRLIQAVDAFYAAPSHERPRDSEGWERLGLYEYFKAKNLARKQKEDDITEGRRDKSRSPTPIRRDSSPSGGRSPPRRRYQSKSPTPQRSSRRRSRSRSPGSGSSSSRRKKSNRRSRSRSRSPPRRSPTPPSFSSAGFGMDRKLDESNKGHQLLMKMGWGGTGLGAKEQGIEAPIAGGEVRERKDQYKGVGVSVNDPFENYRKSKGQAFVERMRARAEERI